MTNSAAMTMTVNYATTKEMQCYKDFVNNPTDKVARRAFTKMFPASWAQPAIKLHNRLCDFLNAEDYNKVFGRTDNRIEIKSGGQGKEPLVLKVRVGLGARKFFYHINPEQEPTLRKNWTGNFSLIETILVIKVNNHNYDF